MSTQAHNVPAEFPVPADARFPARSTRGGRIGPVSVDRLNGESRSQVSKVGLSEICLSYRAQSGEQLLALDHINLQVRAGEFVCIVGPSGCGKSTLLHLIAGLNSQTSGQIMVDGNPVDGPGRTAFLSFRTTACSPG